MATGHVNPGYGNIVSQMPRAQNAEYNNFVPGTKSLRSLENVPMDNRTLDQIRRQATEAWTPKSQNQTSYQDHYVEKHSKIGEFATTRPTSAGRKNNPHPPMVFLTNRLHYCPGYHNADTTLGRDPYQIDASVVPGEWSQRAKLRGKFVGRPSSAALNQYKEDDEALLFVGNPLERRVQEAMIGKCNDENVLGSMNEFKYGNGINVRGAVERSYRPRTVPSLHRYLKHAGAEESTRLNDIYERHMSGYGGQPGGRYDFGSALDDINYRRRDDMYNMLNVTTKINNGRASRRGDFLIHPQWPPSFTAHRLNGLSSVDVPFSKSFR